jgi:hypothetical protein
LSIFTACMCVRDFYHWCSSNLLFSN